MIKYNTNRTIYIKNSATETQKIKNKNSISVPLFLKLKLQLNPEEKFEMINQH